MHFLEGLSEFQILLIHLSEWWLIYSSLHKSMGYNYLIFPGVRHLHCLRIIR